MVERFVKCVCIMMDKCRIFSQHFFGVDKGGTYHLLDTDEMMQIKKSKVAVCLCWFLDGIVLFGVV